METIGTTNLLITDLYPKIVIAKYGGQLVVQMRDVMKMQSFIKKSLKERPDDEILKKLLNLVQKEKNILLSGYPETMKSIELDAMRIFEDITIHLSDLNYVATINKSPTHGLVITPDRRVSDEDLFKVNRSLYKNDGALLVRDSDQLD